MGYRILVDENIDPKTANYLSDLGHDADHIETTLGKGTKDSPIAEHAREQDLLLLTNDADFLRPERGQTPKVLYLPDNKLRAHDIARLVDELARLVHDSSDLPRVTWITE